MHSRLDRETLQQLLANAFAVQESQIDRRSLAAIMEVQQLVARGELTADGAMHHLVESARNVADATGVAIGLLQGDKLIYRAGSGSSAPFVGRQVNASLTVAADIKASREILRVEDAQTDPRIQAAICRQYGVQSLLILPIYQTRTLAGVLEILFSEAHSFQDCEVRTYRLMIREIEAAMAQASRLALELNRTDERQATPPAVEQIAPLEDQSLGHTGSLAGVPAEHSIDLRRGTAPTAMEMPTLQRLTRLATKSTPQVSRVPWLGHQRNLALAGAAIVLAFTCWLAYSSRRPTVRLETSALPTSTAVEQQARSPEASPGKTTSTVQPGRAPVKEAAPVGSKFRRVRVGKNEVDYIAEDVTVRYFTYAPAPKPRPTGDSQVKYIGDDVTVRYFPPNPATRSGGR
jgi:hypothetical protein